MAGEPSAVAFSEFVQPLQRAISTVSPAVLVRRGPMATGLAVLTFGTGETVAVAGPHRLAFKFIQHSRMVRGRGRRASQSVQSTGYVYELVLPPEDPSQGPRSVVAYHWHPETTPELTLPHAHLRCHEAPIDLRRSHLPTGQVSLQAVSKPRRGSNRYWMTSVTCSMISGGKVIPSAWAVLRLTTKSKRMGRSTGRSAGFTPLSTLST